MIIDRLPRRKVVGQLTPLAARAHHVQNPIHDLLLGMLIAFFRIERLGEKV